jgi:xanthine/uracil permease
MCLAAHVKALDSIPASVYGYAATAAYLLQTPDALDMGALTGVNFGNALIIIAVSLVVGAIFGLLSGKVGGMLTSGD